MMMAAQPSGLMVVKVPRKWNCSLPKSCFLKFAKPTNLMVYDPPPRRILEKARMSDAIVGKTEKTKIMVTAGARKS